jgi:hypothetical protein
MSHSLSRRAMVSLVGLLLFVVLAMSALANAGVASAATYYELRARHSDKCLDVANFSFDHGADVIQGNCWGGRNQQWTFLPTDGGYSEVHARHSGKCLDVANYSYGHGANVLQANCWGGRNQQWKLVATDSGYVRLIARHSNRCLDVANLSIAHGADVIQGTCWSPGPNQQWRLVYKATA